MWGLLVRRGRQDGGKLHLRIAEKATEFDALGIGTLHLRGMRRDHDRDLGSEGTHLLLELDTLPVDLRKQRLGYRRIVVECGRDGVGGGRSRPPGGWA